GTGGHHVQLEDVEAPGEVAPTSPCAGGEPVDGLPARPFRLQRRGHGRVDRLPAGDGGPVAPPGGLAREAHQPPLPPPELARTGVGEVPDAKSGWVRPVPAEPPAAGWIRLGRVMPAASEPGVSDRAPRAGRATGRPKTPAGVVPARRAPVRPRGPARPG